MRIGRIRFFIILGAILIFAGIITSTNRDVFKKNNNSDCTTYNKLSSYESSNTHVYYSGILQGSRIFKPEFLAQVSENEKDFFFIKMTLIISIICIMFLGFMLMNVRLIIISLIPIFSSIVCAFGLMSIATKSLNIPGIILALCIPVLSTSGSFAFVRSYQRYQNQSYWILNGKRISILIGFIAMIAGLLFLLTTNSNLLKNAGLLIPLCTGFLITGAFVILQFLLISFDKKESEKKCLSENLQERVIWRYRNMDAYSRFFGYFKIRLDPMFTELPELLEKIPPAKTIIDIGTGFGVPAVWFLEKFPNAKIFGLDPAKDRIRVAAMVTQERGTMVVGGAPEVPSPPEPGDLATMLDMIQYIDDNALETTLKRLAEKLRSEGNILLRISVPFEKGNPWAWWLERIRVKTQNISTYYRPVSVVEEMLQKAGFTIQFTGPSGDNGDLFWILGTIKKDNPSQ